MIAAIAFVLTGCLTSCVVEDGLKPGESQGDVESYFVQFVLNPGSRSDGRTRAVEDGAFDSDGHPEENGLAPENYISTEDMRIFLFTRDGILLQELTPEPVLNQTGIVFNARLVVRSEQLADDAGNVEFSLVALANWESINGSYPTLTPIQSTLEQLGVSEANIFTQNPLWTPVFNSQTLSGNGIPMYGRQNYSGITLDMMKATSRENPLKLYSDNAVKKAYEKDIQLLRSLAKFEVADNISDKTDGYPKVTGVRLLNYRKDGLYIPDASAFTAGYNQVVKTSLPASQALADNKSLKAVGAYQTGLSGDFGDEWRSKFPGGWFSTYIPEMEYSPADGVFQLSVDVQMSADAGDVETRTVPVPGFRLSGTAQSGIILRNHIYRIEVNMTHEVEEETNIVLVYGICPWVEETITIPPFN